MSKRRLSTCLREVLKVNQDAAALNLAIWAALCRRSSWCRRGYRFRRMLNIATFIAKIVAVKQRLLGNLHLHMSSGDWNNLKP